MNIGKEIRNMSMSSWVMKGRRTNGRRIMSSSSKALTFLLGLFLAATMAQAAELTDIQVESSSDEVRFVLDLDTRADVPNVFTTDDPARIIVELSDTRSAINVSDSPVRSGPVKSYTAMSADERTRVVIDLSRMAPYDIDVSGRQIVLAVQTGDTSPASASSAATATVSSHSASDRSFEVEGFDFRRGPDGESRVLVGLDGSVITLYANQRTGGLNVDLLNAHLPQDLYQRLDVSDFATPVQMITPQQRGDNVRISLDIAGPYEYLAYQSGGQVVVEVSEARRETAKDREVTFFEERDYEGSRITLNFQDMPIRSVLALIADVSEKNVVVSDSVGGNLTLRLTNVPWDQALDIVLETKNLDMRESGNVLWIAPFEEINTREEMVLRERSNRQALEPLQTAIIPLSYAKAEKLANLIDATKDKKSAEDDESGSLGLLSFRGSVTYDERTNTLLISDISERVDALRALVSELDRPVRQVHIESRIVIARSDFNHELGVRFGGSGARQDSRGNLYTLASNSEGADGMIRDGLANRREGSGSSTPVGIPSLEDRLNVNLPVANPTGSLGVSVLAADFLLDLELSALESEGRGEIVSTPRVITANQTEAAIRQGVEIPYESTQGGGQAGAVNVQFKDAVLELRVTPRITPDNRVNLELHVSQDTVGELYPNGRGSFIPSIDTRTLDTTVLVDNGQTVVLGGIYQEERTYQNQKVPVLGDVPLLGALFRSRSSEEEKREMLIFVTPSILDDRVATD